MLHPALAILAAVAANTAVGFLWYLPQTFGRMWMQDIGMDPAKAGQDKKEMTSSIIKSVLSSAVTATVLWYVHFVLGFAELRFFLVGILLMWLAFTAGPRYTHSIFEGKGLRYNLITSGHDLVSMLVMGSVVYFGV